MRTETVILPAFLASALINGDTSGLEEQDMQWLEAAVAAVAPGRIVGCEGEPYFSRYCDLPGWRLMADMLDYTVLYNS